MSDAASMETAFDMLAWRERVSRTVDVRPADLADWAARLHDAGHGPAASLLEDVAALHAGFPDRSPDPHGRPAGAATMRATTELERLGRIAATIDMADRPTPPVDDVDTGDIAATARDLRDLLEQPLGERAGLLAAMLRGLVFRPRVDHRRFAHASLSVLVPVIAANALIDFAQRMRDLWDAPSGSPALLHRAAQLDRGGLGPYFDNVGRLARHSRDVFALADVARGAAAQAGATDSVATPAPWIALLSRGCGAALLDEIIDDLGDMAAGDAMLAILVRVLIRPPAMIDPNVVMRLRDAALDNADYPLAMQAQAAVVRLRPDSELETALLGAIQASGGAWHRARATFRGWQQRADGDGQVRERLTALEAGRFAPFVVDRGFGSPPDRQVRRLRRRGILPDYPRRPGERIDAVQVH